MTKVLENTLISTVILYIYSDIDITVLVIPPSNPFGGQMPLMKLFGRKREEATGKPSLTAKVVVDKNPCGSWVVKVGGREFMGTSNEVNIPLNKLEGFEVKEVTCNGSTYEPRPPYGFVGPGDSVYVNFVEVSGRREGSTLNSVKDAVKSTTRTEVTSARVVISLDDIPKYWMNRKIGPYLITEVVGEGGTSYVLGAELGGAKYVLKVPKYDVITKSEEALSDLARELSALQEVSGKNPLVVRLYGVNLDLNVVKALGPAGYKDSPPYIVMERMDSSVIDLMKDDSYFFSSYWQGIVALVLARTAAALNSLHSIGYVHLDVKPSNIFLKPKPSGTAQGIFASMFQGSLQVKLGDFGAVKRNGQKVEHSTFEYSPPEQVMDSPASSSMDIYALGATGFSMLTRKALNPADLYSLLMKGEVSLEAVTENIRRNFRENRGKEPLWDVIERCIDPEPTRRPNALEAFQSFTSVAKALQK